MFHKLLRLLKKRAYERRERGSVDPDEIFLDSSNIPSFDRDQFEGRIETPITKRYLIALAYLFALVACIYTGRAFLLQILSGEFYFNRAATNNLRREVIFAHRGIIVDRTDKPLVWNEDAGLDNSDKRVYAPVLGLANILGFVKYPGKDSSGNFYSYAIAGQDGVEKYYDKELSGSNGVKLSEVSVKGVLKSQSTLEPPVNGDKLFLSIDAGVQTKLYEDIKDAVDGSGFVGGAGVIMDVKTGEILAGVSYPSFDPNVMTDGSDRTEINTYIASKRLPFLDRITSGLYAPGSIVKPFVALGILQENIINPLKEIHTIGYLSVPNPYDSSKPTIFKDWKNHGSVDMRRAIAVSSDVYFYITGGGFDGQKGLGITKIDQYLSKFLLGIATEGFFAGPAGVIPTPEWKKKTFNGEEWRVGNTYHTAIGQYGFQVTPLQMVRAIGGVATEGAVVSPTILKDEQGSITTVSGIDRQNYKVVKEGMRMAVTEGTAIALGIPGLPVAAKTGTAEVGVAKDRVNSWVVGFFPYDKPRYAFALVLENGPTTYAVSAMRAMSGSVYYIRDYAPEYVGGEKRATPTTPSVSTSTEVTTEM